jgi:diadenosine tetraphosphate (Ap4A) HIT family hydrolase
MIGKTNFRHFLPLSGRNIGAEHRLVLAVRSAELRNSVSHLGSLAAAAELREQIIPDFMAQAGINNLQESGLRLTVDAAPYEAPIVRLTAGPDVPAQNPQDWLSPSVVWNPQAKADFFELCAKAAAAGDGTMKFGNEMFYAVGNREIFGVMDGNPKQETHFLVLASAVFGNIMDRGFTAAHLHSFFETAFAICRQLGVMDQPIRYVANTGTGFQQGPRVHLHVLSDHRGLPSMSPEAYGFNVGNKGVISAPAESLAHLEVMNLISRRLEIKEFTAEAKAAKLELDAQLFSKLAALKKQ